MFHCFYVVYPDCNDVYCAVLLIGLPPVYDWVRVAHIIILLYYVVFCVLCLSSSCVYCAQCCLFMIVPSVFCNVYLSCFVCAQILPVSLDCPFFIAPSCCQCLWIVHSLLPLRVASVSGLSILYCPFVLSVSLDFPFVIAPSALLTYICICFVLQFILLYHLLLKQITRLKIYFGISIFVMHGE